MRCKICDYPLWNLKARKCPECGTPFIPSDHEFVANSVRFCCPQCDQAYYGTGHRGHLIPLAFNCIKCGLPLNMDDMVLRPAEGVQEEQTQINRMPWLERKQCGFLRGWSGTVFQSMGSPGRLMRALPADSSQAQAWWYAAVTIGAMMFLGVFLGFAGVSLLLMIDGSSNAFEPLLVGGGFLLIGTPLIVLLAWIWAAVTHALLKLTGGTAHSMGRTVQAIMYGSGTQLPMSVPFVGPYCGIYLVPIWWMVSAVLMVAEAQRVKHGRASLAVLLLPAIIMIGAVSLVGFAVYSVFSMQSYRSATTSSSVNRANTLMQTQALIVYAADNNGQWPAHASQLVANQSLPAMSFVSTNSAADETTILVGDITLNDLQYLPDNRRAMAAQAAADALPPNVVAHRLGDYVFTYHGIDPNSANPQLWIVIKSNDPAQHPFNDPAESMAVGMADGTVKTYSYPLFAAALADQNALRTSLGLPPLPVPRTVLHDAPAVAP